MNNKPIDSNITSGEHRSFWTESTEPLKFSKLKQSQETDVLVIGGGIAGLTTAYCLLKAGKKVVVLEDGYLGSGETGRTTAHITCALDDRYYYLQKLFGLEKTTLVANSHMSAIEWIQNTVKLENIDCNFKRVDGHLFLSSTDEKKSLDLEYESTKQIGLITRMLDHIPFVNGEDNKWCIQFPGQGQFHIMKYLKGLSDSIIKMGGKIFTETKAEEISKNGAKANGFYVKADHIVVATNTPVNDWVTMHTKQWPYRTYVIAGKVPKGRLPYALWWDTGNMESKWIVEPYHYVRVEPYNELFDLLIAGGEDHKVGQAESEHISEQDRYSKLYEWTRKRFPEMREVTYKWSGQVMEPIDSLAFIGKNPGDENIYIITGDSGNGMTYGTLGGIIITDLITGRKNIWEETYNPSRITLKSAGDYIHEAANMTAQYSDWLKSGDVKSVDELKTCEGGILTSGLKKIAVYRDQNNKLHSCSAICPHLGAILKWNADEKSFDCPAHGSRFTTDGKLINGPATTDLKLFEINEEEKLGNSEVNNV